MTFIRLSANFSAQKPCHTYCLYHLTLIHLAGPTPASLFFDTPLAPVAYSKINSIPDQAHAHSRGTMKSQSNYQLPQHKPMPASQAASQMIYYTLLYLFIHLLMTAVGESNANELNVANVFCFCFSFVSWLFFSLLPPCSSFFFFLFVFLLFFAIKFHL